MKQSFSCILILSMLLALLTGCGTHPEAAETVSPANESAAAEAASKNQVSTVDEFLAALKSETEITMAPGTYDLTTASDYGKASEVYSWNEETGALWIKGLNGLTIHGNGAEVFVDGEKRVPLVFDECQDLHLADLTLSHKDPKETGAKTLLISSCQNVTLQNIIFQDSVDALLTLQCSTNCLIENCLFTGASGNAVAVNGSEAVTIRDCEINNLGLPETGEKLPHGMPDFQALISISEWNRDNKTLESKDITLENNTFSDNTAGLLMFVSNSRKVNLLNSLFAGNHMNEAAFCFWTAAPHVVGNTFEGNDPWAWYYPSSSMAVDENGADIPSELFMPDVVLPEAGPQKEIAVTTADEFLAAIGPDTKMILKNEMIDLSTASDYGKGKAEFYYWKEEYDGPSVVITGVNNMTITSLDEDCKTHTISALPRYADVLSFEFSTNITLSHFTAGHTVKPGFCMGGVLRFKECRNTTIDHCGLYGCGILGVIAHGGEKLNIINSDIYECSNGGVSLVDVNGVNIENTTFRDLGGPALYVRNCQDAIMDGKEIPQEE